MPITLSEPIVTFTPGSSLADVTTTASDPEQLLIPEEITHVVAFFRPAATMAQLGPTFWPPTNYGTLTRDPVDPWKFRSIVVPWVAGENLRCAVAAKVSRVEGRREVAVTPPEGGGTGRT